MALEGRVLVFIFLAVEERYAFDLKIDSLLPHCRNNKRDYSIEKYYPLFPGKKEQLSEGPEKLLLGSHSP